MHFQLVNSLSYENIDLNESRDKFKEVPNAIIWLKQGVVQACFHELAYLSYKKKKNKYIFS